MPTTEKKSAAATTPHYETGPIVVGADGSPGGEDAVALAHDLAGAGSRRTVAEKIPGVVAPSLGLVGLAEREDAGTLVVGSPHRGPVGRALLGSVAHHVLHHAPCEVVVAPRGYRERERKGIAKIAVAYDGTPEAGTALRRAEALARDTGASLRLIVAEDPIVAGIEGGDAPRPLTDAAAVLSSALASIAPSLEADGEAIDPGWRTDDKTIAEALAGACGPDVDVLVAGTRRPLDRVLLGAVGTHLIDVAPCAVLIVPHEEEGAVPQVEDEDGKASVSGAGPIVVGSDGSPGGEDAVALAHDLAGTSGRRLVVEKVSGPVAPSPGLIGIAEREGAGTLVVGSPHRGPVGRALLGSVAHHVLHHAPCEVIVAPRGYRERERTGIAKIAVAYDGTGEADAALRRAEGLARTTGASLHLIVAEDPVVAGVVQKAEFSPLTNAPAVLARALETIDPAIEADGSHINPGWRKVDKSVAEAIARACDDDVDILVAGTRKPLDRLLLGSITGHLIDVAPCAVLVVPHEEGT